VKKCKVISVRCKKKYLVKRISLKKYLLNIRNEMRDTRYEMRAEGSGLAQAFTIFTLHLTLKTGLALKVAS
jgi:hypothetical protein